MRLRFALALALLTPAACSGGATPSTLQTVEHVDLERYVGTWYEIGRYPNRFQKGCVATTATYEKLAKPGRVRVINRCRKDTVDGRKKVARGKAWRTDHPSNARLKVSFFWPFAGDYWIIDLDEEYEWAVVGTPSRGYLWVLSRSPTMDDEVYAGIEARLVEQGYDPARIVRHPQRPG